jgi:Na+/phosphate symporter
MNIYLAVVVCIAGLLVYAISNNPKAMEIGRIAFFAGLLVTLMQWGARL